MKRKSNEIDTADYQDDPPLTPAQLDAVSALDKAALRKIDEAILGNVTDNWRKVAIVVGITMQQNALHIKGVPDVFYAQRVILLVEKGILEVEGDLRRMRRCEVRFRQSNTDADRG